MNLPFEPDLSPPEETRRHINCDECGTELYYESKTNDQSACYNYNNNFYCEDCITDIVKTNTYWRLEN